jgi:hypothetical protein
LKPHIGRLSLASLAVLAAVAQQAYGQVTESQESIIRIVSVKKPPMSASSFIEQYGLTRDDFACIRRVTSVHQAVPLRALIRDVRHGDRKVRAKVIGTTPQLAALRGLQVMRGRFLTAADIAWLNNIAVIDSTAARTLFPFSEAIGKNIRVGTHYFLIVGETKSPREHHDPLPVYVPISTMRSRLGDVVIERTRGELKAERYEISEVLLSVDNPRQAAKTLEAVQRLLAESHETEDYSIQLMP